MMTYKNLVLKYLNLEVGNIIHIDRNDYIVIENHKHDVVFLAQVNNQSKSFHIFYQEMNPETDDFYIVQ